MKRVALTIGGLLVALVALRSQVPSAITPADYFSTPGSVRYTTVTVTSTQIQALSGTPVTLVPAQGAGTLIEPVSVLVNYIYGGTAYVNGGGGAPSYGIAYATRANTVAPFGDLSSFITGTANAIDSVPSAEPAAQPSSGFLNQPLVLANAQSATHDVVTGNGTFLVQTAYRIHTGLN